MKREDVVTRLLGVIETWRLHFSGNDHEVDGFELEAIQHALTSELDEIETDALIDALDGGSRA